MRGYDEGQSVLLRALIRRSTRGKKPDPEENIEEPPENLL